METVDYRAKALSIVRDPDVIDLILDEIKTKRLSSKAFARVFEILYFSHAEEAEIISFSKSSNEWRRGRKTISDVKLFGAISNACDAIRYCLLSEWDNSVFGAILSQKAIQDIQDKLDSMETMENVRSILEVASLTMLHSNSDGTINWGDATEDNEDIGGA